MPREAMAPNGADDLTMKRSGVAARPITLGPSRPPRRSGLIVIMSRSAIVCGTLAAGISVIALGDHGWRGFQRAEAAAPRYATPDGRPPAPLSQELADAWFGSPRLRRDTETTAAVQPEAVSASEAEADRLLSMVEPVPDIGPPPVIRASALVGTADPNETLAFGPMRIRRYLVEIVLRAARAVEADPVLMLAIADKESSFLTEVQARTSSATGLFQFIERTWLTVVRDFGAKHGLTAEAQAIAWVDDNPVVADQAERQRILDLRSDPYLAALLAGEMLNRDRTKIGAKIGRELTHGETYLAHFLGADDTERFLSRLMAEPNATAASLLPRPARANRPIFYERAGRKTKSRSVAEVHQAFEDMIGRRLDRYRNVHQAMTATALTEIPQIN